MVTLINYKNYYFISVLYVFYRTFPISCMPIPVWFSTHCFFTFLLSLLDVHQSSPHFLCTIFVTTFSIPLPSLFSPIGAPHAFLLMYAKTIKTRSFKYWNAGKGRMGNSSEALLIEQARWECLPMDHGRHCESVYL